MITENVSYQRFCYYTQRISGRRRNLTPRATVRRQTDKCPCRRSKKPQLRASSIRAFLCTWALSGALSTLVRGAGTWGTVPAGCCSLLLLGLLAGQLVDLGGSIHVSDGGGELEFFPTVDTQITWNRVLMLDLFREEESWDLPQYQLPQPQAPFTYWAYRDTQGTHAQG